MQRPGPKECHEVFSIKVFFVFMSISHTEVPKASCHFCHKSSLDGINRDTIFLLSFITPNGFYELLPSSFDKV